MATTHLEHHQRLKRERAKASQRLKQKVQQWALKADADKATHAGPARLALAMKALLGNPGAQPKRKHQPSDDWEDRRRLNLELAALKAQHWDWSREQLLAEAERRLFVRAPHRA